MARLFGTDGIRGEAGKFPLDAATVHTLGSSLTIHLRELLTKDQPVIVTGRDTRESGAWLERALIAGATAAGARCESAGVITTPGVAFLARTLPAHAGVVISASHNPYQDNGVKIFSPSGKKLEDATERLIEVDILSEGKALTDREQPGEPTADDENNASLLRTRYLDFLAEEIGTNLSLDGLKMVIDCANGAASELAPALFSRLGARVVVLNNQPDGRNINLNCGSLHVEGLQERVAREAADIGVAYDGDADRSLFVDAKGNFVDGDAVMFALANYLSERGELNHGIIVSTVMSNIGLEIALRERGLRLVRTDVGDKFVLEELLRTGASLGGEQSGHLIFPRLSLAGDGLLTTLFLLRAMREGGKSLLQLTVGFERYPQILINVRVREKRPFSDMPSVEALARDIVNSLDDRGRLLLRYSGTESLARVMIEGESHSQIEDYANRLAGAIRSEIGAS